MGKDTPQKLLLLRANGAALGLPDYWEMEKPKRAGHNEPEEEEEEEEEGDESDEDDTTTTTSKPSTLAVATRIALAAPAACGRRRW